MKDALLIDAIRTPIGSFCGSLSSVRADDMAALVIAKLLERSPSVGPASVADVVFGCANQAGEDNRNVARMALLLAGLPTNVPGETVNRLCASGMSAVVHAARAIMLGNGDLYIAGGVESMTRAPYVLSKSETPFSRSAELFDTSIGWRFVNPKMKERYGVDSMGETAENVAREYRISREEQDTFALASQQKASKAQTNGRFKSEIVSVPIQKPKAETINFENDEFIKPTTSMEALQKLKPAFRKDGTVTAGNSAGINDGACAILLSSPEGAKKFGVKPRGKIIQSAVVGVEPRIMGIGPVLASQKVLEKADLSLDDMAVIELNEAFAAQSVACIRELGLRDTDARINPNGGAIALGHPLGMSGARLIMSALTELEQRKEKFALCTMCVGVGQGMAVIIERLDQ